MIRFILCKFLQVILGSSQYPQFLDHSLKIFLKILQDGEPHFIAEYNIQQVRKLILEMIHRLPLTDTLRLYMKSILVLMLKLMEIENEENVLVCLKIFMELHKHYRPAYSPDVDVSIFHIIFLTFAYNKYNINNFLHFFNKLT